MDLSKTQAQSWSNSAVMSTSIHSAPKKMYKNQDVVNIKMAKNIQLQFGVTVPVVSGENIGEPDV